MALAEHRGRRDIGGFGLLDRQLHRPLVDDVAEAPMAVDDRRGRRFLDDLPRRARDDVPDLDALDIGRDLDHPVRVVAGEVGGNDMPHDGLGLLGRRPRRDEQCPSDFAQAFGR